MADVLFVKSKVRAYIKGKGLHTAGEVLDGEPLNVAIMGLLDKAIDRAIANSRKTLQGKDL